MSDNYRLAEHNVEMTLLGAAFDGSDNKVFENEEAGSEYRMSETKWEAAGKPETIYVNVTAVIPTSEPANGVEVVSSTASNQMSEEEQERNPSVVAQ